MPRRALLLSLSLLSVTGPAFAQRAPVITILPPQFAVLGAVADAPLIPARRGQTHPTVASNGDGWLVAWSDSRYADTSSEDRIEDVFATIVDASGRVVHPEGIPVAPTWTSDRFPSAVWTGTDYLVIWSSPLGIFGAHLDTAGRVTRSGLIVEPGQHPMFQTALARSGERLLLLWSEVLPASRPSLRWVLLDLDGTLLTAPADLAATLGSQRNPSVAPLNGGFAVAWEEIAGSESTVFATVVAPDATSGPVYPIGAGPSVSEDGRSMWTGQASPSVAAGADEALIVWSDGTIRARRFAPSGPASETATIPSEPVAITPTALFRGSGWEIIWSAGSPGHPALDLSTDVSTFDLFSATLDAALSPSGLRRIASARNAQIDPAAASNGSEIFIAWTDARLGSSTDSSWNARFTGDLFGGRMAEIASTGGDLLAKGIAEQRAEGVAVLGETIRALWVEEEDDDDTRLLTRAFSRNGEPLDEIRPVAKNSRGRIASSGSQFAIACSDSGGDVFVVRITPDGSLSRSDIAAYDARYGGRAPAIASDGTDFLVAWDAPGPDFSGVFASVVMQTGLVSAPLRLAPEMGQAPLLAWTGSGYFAVWTRLAYVYSSAVAARFVSPAGIPLGEEPVTLAPLSSRFGPWPSSVASAGNEHFVAFGDRLLRTGSGGTVIDIRETSSGPRGVIALLWTGESLVVTFVDPRWPRPAGRVLSAVAVGGPREVVGIGEDRFMPLPAAHPHAVARVILMKATVDSPRPRLVGR